jgi:hypothetical protein
MVAARSGSAGTAARRCLVAGLPTPIRMGTFDGDPGIRPSVRQFVSYAAPWDPIPTTDGGGCSVIGGPTASRLQHACHVDDHDMAMGSEPAVRGQLARAHLEPQGHRRATGIAFKPALTHIGRTFRKGANEREDSGPRLPNAPGLAPPFEIEDVAVRRVYMRAHQPEALVVLAPRVHVGSEMELRLLGHPGRLAERLDQFSCSGDELTGVTNAVASIVVIPAFPHALKLQQTQSGAST